MQRDWITTAIDHRIVRGAIELEHTPAGLRPRRLPAWARAQSDSPHLAAVEAQPTGVRLEFRTSATSVELDILTTRLMYADARGPLPHGVYDILVDGALRAQATVAAGNVLVLDRKTGATELTLGQQETVRYNGLPGREKVVEIWLPHNESTELLALRTDAPTTPVHDDGRRVWMHHGSSISHGLDAYSPTGTWPAVAATTGGVGLINTSFGDNALLDPFTARTMRDVSADLISIKIGVNLVNRDLIRKRAFAPAVHGFLDTIRDGHPTAPLVVASPIHCPIHEDRPGPTVVVPGENRSWCVATGVAADAEKLTLGWIRNALENIVGDRAKSDPNIHYLDGRRLYGEDDYAILPLPDELRPSHASHRQIGRRFAAWAFSPGGAFSPVPDSEPAG
ncbi:lipase [Kribbella sandramycini]|uniref:Lipase n=1 Tax=Kribbella sandramycini TaxID=60450 RepID=A0A7Y4NZ02_9ACTN|nr:SGNH/GDSL hydrolase family protein [Kribbella sandramycini]MBB6567723.1 hypothetical protein [Kribbella sandramycini]NOL39680.1 lipase [Kribbella sandramycini]